MNANQLLAHYEQVADAPDAIARLRRFILDLAVRGKLVEQNPNDEPASELLKRISEEKARLVKAKKISKQVAFQPPDLSEVSFDLPGSWDWCPSTYPSYIVSDRGKKIQTKDVVETGKFPVVDQGKVLIRGYHNDVNKVIRIKEPIVLFGDHTREMKLIDFDFIVGADGVKLLHPVSLHTAYYFLVLQWLPLKNRGYGRHFKLLKASFIPLPPLAEQHRIVAKVDELMTLCDRLEEGRTARETTRDRLAAASLARLNAPDPELALFRNHASFALENLAPLTTRFDQIKPLRQTILNLAVRGKLVEQDPIEGTGQALLFELRKIRNTWETSGRVRKQKVKNAVADDEQYLDLPTSWAWMRLIDVGQTQTGTSPSSAITELFGDFIPFVKPADLDGNKINYGGPGLSEKGVDHSRLVPENSVLMVCIGATLGKVNKTTRSVCFNQQINSLNPFVKGVTGFVALALKASSFQELAWSKAGTGTLPIISKGKWEVLPVPLPPLAEQHRIVAKVDELMTLCDQLEANLATSDDTRRRLLDALLHEVLPARRSGGHLTKRKTHTPRAIRMAARG